MATSQQLADEARRARKVRHLVDIATALIMQSEMTREEAEKLVEALRQQVTGLFSGSEGTFDLLYARRFSRLIDEYARATRRSGGAVLPFVRQRGDAR